MGAGGLCLINPVLLPEGMYLNSADVSGQIAMQQHTHYTPAGCHYEI